MHVGQRVAVVPGLACRPGLDAGCAARAADSGCDGGKAVSTGAWTGAASSRPRPRPLSPQRSCARSWRGGRQRRRNEDSAPSAETSAVAAAMAAAAAAESHSHEAAQAAACCTPWSVMPPGVLLRGSATGCTYRLLRVYTAVLTGHHGLDCRCPTCCEVCTTPSVNVLRCYGVRLLVRSDR